MAKTKNNNPHVWIKVDCEGLQEICFQEPSVFVEREIKKLATTITTEWDRDNQPHILKAFDEEEYFLQLAIRSVRGWRGRMVDGKDVAFSEDALLDAIACNETFTAISKALTSFQVAKEKRKKAEEKN